MQRKKTAKFFWIFLALAAMLCLAACAGSAKPGTVQSLFCSEKKIESLQANRTQSRKNLVEEISIGSIPLVEDAATGSYYYSMPQGGKTRDLEVLWSGKDRVKLAILQNFEGKDLPSGQTVELIAYTKTEWQKIELVCTPLPIMSLQVEGDAEAIEKYESSPVQMTLMDNRETAGLHTVQSAGAIHVRGVGSARFPKKGYRLTLRHGNGEENDMALLGLRNDGDWILYAGYTETEKVRQVFSTKIWREGCGKNNSFGVQNSNDYRYLELFLNGRYWGLYALGYPIDAKQLHIGEGEYIFSKQDFLVSESGIDFDTEAEIPGYEIMAGDTVNTDWASIWKPIKSYYKTLLAKESTNAELKALADENSAIDAWLFTNLIQGVDQVLDEGTLYNYRLTTKQTKEGVKILFTPWDFDLSWGAVSAENPESMLSPEENILMNLNPVHSLLQRGDAETLAAVENRYKALREGAWSEESMMELIDGYEEDIFASGAYERDFTRWPESAHHAGQTDLSEFKKYVAKRLESMDVFMNGLEKGYSLPAEE